MKWGVAGAWALTVLLALPAGAAVIYLKDGGQIEGTILSRTPAYVEVATGGATVRIGSDKILRIDESAPAPRAAPAPAPPGWREAERPPWEDSRETISLDFGAAFPLSNVELSGLGGSVGNGDAGGLIGFQYLHALAPRWSVGFDLNFFDRSWAHSQDALANTDVRASGDDLVMLALGKYSFREEGRVRPYAAAGFGVGRNSTEIDAVPDPGFVWSDTLTHERRRLVDDSAWTWASSLRAGLDFPLGPQVFSLELGWTHLGSGSLHPTGAGQALGLGDISSSLDAMTIAGRWGWRF